MDEWVDGRMEGRKKGYLDNVKKKGEVRERGRKVSTQGTQTNVCQERLRKEGRKEERQKGRKERRKQARKEGTEGEGEMEEDRKEERKDRRKEGWKERKREEIEEGREGDGWRGGGREGSKGNAH